MGTLADLLGGDGLAALASLAGTTEDDAPGTSLGEGTPESAPGAGDMDEAGAGADGEAAPDPVAEAVMAAVLEETTLEPGHARPELSLDGDLDLDELALWSVVAAVEHDLHVTFTDADVRGWRTLGDLLDAAREASAR